MTISTVAPPTRRAAVAAPLPARIWTARALRDVDARGRAELALVGQVRALAAGQSVYRQGDAAEGFFVVTQGEVALEREGRVETARVGETFGAESFVHPAARRSSGARATVASEIVELPARWVQRVALRSQAAESALVDPRMVRRVLADAVERIGRGVLCLPADTSWLDGVTSQRLAHGEPLRPTGDAAALVLHGGLREVGGERHGTGSLVTLASADELVAVDHAWIALLSPAACSATSAASASRAATVSSSVVDPVRVLASRSLLVLDGDDCVRCGHCVASCASAHDDGLPRLVRQGPSLFAGSALVLPGNCGHCTHAACLLDCPTEAISRDATGAVQIREDACTGCGRCVEACPWGNVRLAVSLREKPVAVKCDLCRGEHARGSEPACVASCPVEALVRLQVDVGAASDAGGMAEGLDAAVEKALASPAGASRAARGIERGAHVATIALGTVTAFLANPRTCGEVAALLFLALAAHALIKRRMRRGHAVARSYRAHLAFAGALVPLLVRHVEASGAATRAGILSPMVITALLALASGAFGAVAYALLPRRLGALGDDGTAPDELAREHRRARDQAFLLLTGRDERVKTWWRVRLAPYASSRSGALGFALSRATAASERLRLATEVTRVGQGRVSVADLEPLLEHAVRTRTLAARRLLHHALRGWLPVHLLTAALALALVAHHVALHLLFH